MATYEDFLAKHLSQLISIGLPENLYPRLYEKLIPCQVYDAGDCFVFTKSDTAGQEKYDLRAKTDIKKNNDVFIIDHAWTSDGGEIAKQQLEKMPQLLSRMQKIFSLNEIDCEEDDEYLDSAAVVSQLCSCGIAEARSTLEARNYNLIDSIIYRETDHDQLGNKVKEDAEPECTYEEFKSAFLATSSDASESNISENYLKKLYANFLKQKGKCQGAGMTLQYNWLDNVEDGFVYVYAAIKPQTQKNQIRSTLTSKTWKLEIDNMGTLINGYLHDKIIPDESWWSIESPGVLCMALQKSITSDDLWTELIKGEKQLAPKEIEDFAWRTEMKKSIETGEVLDAMWYYNQIYKIQMADSQEKDSAPVWYVMDEVGSAIGHSNVPNFACSPFFFLDRGLAFSVIWPIKDIEEGDKVTRNFISNPLLHETERNFQIRKSLINAELSHEIERACKDAQRCLNDATNKELDMCHVATSKINTRFTLYCDLIDSSHLAEVASKLGCAVSDSMMDADIVLSAKATCSENIKSNIFINHFLQEEAMFQKDQLRELILKNIGHRQWFPKTFILLNELEQLVEAVSKKSNPVYWIIRVADSSKAEFKPIVTSNVRRISRLCEAGPMIASEYVMDGPLFQDRKFALSYTVLVAQAQPLKIYISKKPFVRTTGKKFNPQKLFDEYDTDATITTKPDRPFNKMYQQDPEDIIKSINDIAKKSKHNRQWTDIEKDIFIIIGTFFNGLKHTIHSFERAKSFAVVGVEFLLDGDLNPVLLGIDRTPTFVSAEQLTEVIAALLCDCSATESLDKAQFVQITSP